MGSLEVQLPLKPIKPRHAFAGPLLCRLGTPDLKPVCGISYTLRLGGQYALVPARMVDPTFDDWSLTRVPSRFYPNSSDIRGHAQQFVEPRPKTCDTKDLRVDPCEPEF